MRAGVAGRAVVFHPPMRARVAVRAAAFQLAMRAGLAVRAAVFQLAMRAGAAGRAAIFPLAMRAPLASCHRLAMARATGARAPERVSSLPSKARVACSWCDVSWKSRRETKRWEPKRSLHSQASF